MDKNVIIVLKPVILKRRTMKKNAVCGKYIDPVIKNIHGFLAWLQSIETQEHLKNKKVLMYCIGLVHCERALLILKREMGESVYQLEGGIEKY